MRKYNITKKFLIIEYVKNKLSQLEIADKIGCSHVTIYRALKRYNIKIRDLKGINNPNFGNHKLVGINNPNWKGGISFEEYGAGFDDILKEQVRFRDHYKCQKCGCSQLENGRQLDCHHIDYNKKNHNINNLISLCISCHMKTNYNRDFWKDYFKIEIKNKENL